MIIFTTVLCINCFNRCHAVNIFSTLLENIYYVMFKLLFCHVKDVSLSVGVSDHKTPLSYVWYRPTILITHSSFHVFVILKCYYCYSWKFTSFYRSKNTCLQDFNRFPVNVIFKHDSYPRVPVVFIICLRHILYSSS